MKESCLLKGSCQVERSIYQATVTCDDDPTYGEKFYIGLAEQKFKKKNFSPTIKHFVTNVTKKRWNFQMRFGDWKEITLLPGRQSDNLHNSIELLLNATSVWIKILRLQPSQKITDSWVTWTGSRWKNYTILKIDVSYTTVLYFIFVIRLIFHILYLNWKSSQYEMWNN